MKKLPITLFVLVGIAPFYLSSSEIKNKLLFCGDLKSDEKRLQCYDQMASTLQALPAQNSTREKNVRSPLPSHDLARKESSNASPHKMANEVSPRQKPAALQQKNFGKSIKEESLKTINSRIVGKFKGWQKGTLLKLENGQIWKVISSTKSYSRLNSPDITISKAVLGSFTAKVEGVTAMAKVKRIK